MRIYTRTGDKGETSLLRGGRVPEHNLRVQTYGTFDELNIGSDMSAPISNFRCVGHSAFSLFQAFLKQSLNIKIVASAGQGYQAILVHPDQ